MLFDNVAQDFYTLTKFFHLYINYWERRIEIPAIYVEFPIPPHNLSVFPSYI